MTANAATKKRQPILNGAIALVLAVLFGVPLLAAVVFSFKPNNINVLDDPGRWLSAGFTMDNYAKLVDYGSGIWTYLGNTILVTVLTVVITTVVSVTAGYGFARYKFRGKGILFALILAIIMVPYQSVLIPLYSFLAKAHLLNNITALAFIYATFQLPFAIYMMRNSFESVPKELEESAFVDGASTIGALRRVVLRLVTPGIVTVVLFAFFAAWNEFLAPLLFLTDDRKYTLPIMLQSVTSGRLGEVDYGALQAGISIAVLPCVVIFLLLQKYYVNGLVSGALKG